MSDMKETQKIFIIFLILAMVTLGCKYVVIPEDLFTESTASEGWGGQVTNVSQAENGDLRIEITIQNETGDWSSMQSVAGKPAVLKSGGETYECDEVFFGTGGYRLAPGFQMRGYTVGSKSDPKTQLIYVQCEGAKAEPGATLSIEYDYFMGDLDYYHQDNNQAAGTMALSLDEIATDLAYPVNEEIAGLTQPMDADFPAISENIVNLLDVQRTDTGFQFTWQNYNPTEFALTTHIGTPPVIGEAGIIYGLYEIMDLAPVPLTPAGEKVQWITEAKVPPDEKGFFTLLSVESKQMRMFVNHLIDITDK
jgi:hypothetical protein